MTFEKPPIYYKIESEPPKLSAEVAVDCKRNQVTLDNWDGCRWIVACDARHESLPILGFVCLAPVKSSWRCKSDYVIPAYRKLGIYRDLCLTRERLAASLGATRLTGFFNKNSLSSALRLGFVQKSYNQRTCVAFCEKLLQTLDTEV